MNRLVLVLMLGLSPLAIQAQTSETATTPPAEQETTVITADPASPVQTAVADKNTHCVRATGSRVNKTDAKGCNGEPGRSYDREDIDKSGAVDTADALRRLDPSVKIGH